MGKKGGGKKGKKGKGPASPKAPAEPPPPPKPPPPPPPPKIRELPLEYKEAAESNDVDKVKNWIHFQNGHVDATYDGGKIAGRTMLMMACDKGAERVVISLLDHEASLDVQDANGDTALMLAALKRQVGYGTHVTSDRIVSNLLKSGASCDIQNKTGRTARSCINPVLTCNCTASLAHRTTAD